jgi:peptidoglycan/LPS O-acetylase OafA/YrhL/lysophospholipase L1-like esterase
VLSAPAPILAAVSTAPPRRFAHQPALDGVRGVAVALVLLFHQGWLSGGYVGVSVFFTLSGYLITSLALVEHDETRRLDVGAFYGRRVRRLLPASLACLVGVSTLAWAGLFRGVEHLRRELWAALAQVYNWSALRGGQSYAQLVGSADAARSPLDHYWSLAIEEQFYWVWPLAMVVILRRPARGRLVLVGALTALAALAAPLIAVLAGPDAAYWATPARLGEILAGALLAVVLHHRGSRRPLPPAVAGLAGGGLAAIACASVLWPRGSGPAYSGWLPVFALATVGLIAGLQVPSVLRSGLSLRPFVVLGAISYGVYLVHWPVFVVLDERRTRLPSVPLFALRIVVTLALAVVSYRYLERPVRAARPRPRAVGVSAATACLAVGVVVALVPAATTPYWMVDDQVAADAAPPTAATTPAATTPAATTPAATTPAATTAPTPAQPAVLAAAATAAATIPPSSVPSAPPLPPAPARAVRAMIVGDSTAMATAKGMLTWAQLHPSFLRVTLAAAPGCGIIPDGVSATDPDGTFARRCAKLRARLAAQQAAKHPDVVLGMVTLTDLDDRTWAPAEGRLSPADQRFFDRLVAAYDDRSTAFLTGGAKRVLWIAPPVPSIPQNASDDDLSAEARNARYVEALRAVAARHPDQVEVVDLPAWLAAQPEQPPRPDGLHWSPAGSRQIATQLLGPVVVAAGA